MYPWNNRDVFRTRRVLDEMKGSLFDIRGTLVEMRGTLVEMRGTLVETSGTLVEISETLQRMDRDSKQTRGAVENNTRVTREILLELREHRPILGRIDHGVQSSNEGLMHVLDELRNGGRGPEPVG